MPHTQRVIAVRDTHLFVDDTGEDDLPVILCLHSLFLDSRMFDGLVDAVRGEFRVVRPEFRGQGRSDFHDVDIITMDDDAEDILALIDLMGLKDINMLVQSMGGDVGVRVAAQRPELFRRIVMAGSSARGETHESYIEWTDRASVNGFVGDVLDETLAVMFGETIRNDPSGQASSRCGPTASMPYRGVCGQQCWASWPARARSTCSRKSPAPY